MDGFTSFGLQAVSMLMATAYQPYVLDTDIGRRLQPSPAGRHRINRPHDRYGRTAADAHGTHLASLKRGCRQWLHTELILIIELADRASIRGFGLFPALVQIRLETQGYLGKRRPLHDGG